MLRGQASPAGDAALPGAATAVLLFANKPE